MQPHEPTTTKHTFIVALMITIALTYTYSISEAILYVQDVQSEATAQLVPATITENSAMSASDSYTYEEQIPMFEVGASVQVIETSKLRVRMVPSEEGDILGYQMLDMSGVVLDGPVYTANHVWWLVDFAEGTDGWVMGDYLSIY